MFARRFSVVVAAVLLVLVAPLAALVVWRLVAPQFQKPDTLHLEFQADQANFGRISWQRPGELRSGEIIAYEDAARLTQASYPLTVTIQPLDSPNPASKAAQIWVYDLRTDKTSTPNWGKIKKTPAPWKIMLDSGVTTRMALMYPGGPPRPYIHRAMTSDGKLLISMLTHPWSGRVRVSLNGKAHEYDLYNPVAVAKAFILDAPRSLDNTLAYDMSSLPAGLDTVRWYIADQQSTVKLTRVQISGTREWEWHAGENLPTIGPGVQVVSNTKDGLILTTEDPTNAWIEFGSLPPPRRFRTSAEDLRLVLGIAACIWGGMLLVALWSLLGRLRRPWLRLASAAVPFVVVAALFAVPLVRGKSTHQLSASDESAHFTVETVVEGLQNPLAIAFSSDGRMFIAEKGGFTGPADAEVKLVRPGEKTPITLLRLPVCANIERGIGGMTLDPNFNTNGYIYLDYTIQREKCGFGRTDDVPYNRVSRFIVANEAIDRASEVVLVDKLPVAAASHNGGGLRFGPDGMLYISTGEGWAGDNAKNLSSLGGKLLRIRPDPNNLVPEDNPFATDADPVKRLIWAYGFRNPYRFGIHPRSGMIALNDVGSDPPKAREEVNLIVRGGYYGWPDGEGNDGPQHEGVIPPVYAYEHDKACNSTIGGIFMTSAVYPDSYRDSYLFGDSTCASIWSLQIDGSGQPLKLVRLVNGIGKFNPVHFELGPDGYVYFADLTGSIRRIVYSA